MQINDNLWFAIIFRLSVSYYDVLERHEHLISIVSDLCNYPVFNSDFSKLVWTILSTRKFELCI